MKSSDADDDQNEKYAVSANTPADHWQVTFNVSEHSTPHVYPSVIADTKTPIRTHESADCADSL